MRKINLFFIASLRKNGLREVVIVDVPIFDQNILLLNFYFTFIQPQTAFQGTKTA